MAQTKPKEDKPPTKKEMDAMMKEMQKAMDEIDPETKRMMDSMGIKIDTKKMAKDASVANDKSLYAVAAVGWAYRLWPGPARHVRESSYLR